jgi:acyl-CoA thioester hydrolase
MSPNVARITRRVVMSDVDAVQVHFAAHFRWFDAAFHELMAKLGHRLSDVIASGHATPVVDAHCSYITPVKIDESIAITAAVVRVGDTSFVVRYDIKRKQMSIATGETTHVWVAFGIGAASPSAVPGWLRSALVEETRLADLTRSP